MAAKRTSKPPNLSERSTRRSRSQDRLRNKILTEACYGRINPKQAEARAAAAGLERFEQSPGFSAFDPMKQSRWPTVMAVAWIAWRDRRLVMEQGAEFRSRSTHWIFRKWNEPIKSGQRVARREGWFLETLHEATVARLLILDVILRSRSKLPSSAQLTPNQAKKELWQALENEDLKAEAFDKNGELVEIPSREWTRLKLFANGKRDILKYDALDRNEPYTEVLFHREDLISHWPAQPLSDSGRQIENEQAEAPKTDRPIQLPPLQAEVQTIVFELQRTNNWPVRSKDKIAAVRAKLLASECTIYRALRALPNTDKS